MFLARTFATLTALSLVIGIGGTSSAAAPAARTPVANASKMDRSAFDKLSDDDVVTVGGKSMSKRDVMAKVKSLREARAPQLTEQEAFEAARDAHEKKQKAALDAENAPVLAKMNALKASGGSVGVRKAGERQTDFVAPTGAVSALATPAPAGAATTPALSGMLGALKPGSAVILFGSSFGTVEGEVRMYGTFPNGFIKLSVDSWGNGGIGVFVPSTVSGVLDQQVTLKVVTKAGASSNYKTAPFTAAREIRKMKMNDFSTRTCVDAALSFDKCTTVGEAGCSSSVCGDHAVMTFPSAAKSTDRFSATLKSQWTFDHYGFVGDTYFSPNPAEWFNPIVLLETYAMGNDKPTVKNLSTATAPKFEVAWSMPSLWADKYKLDVYVEGPKGTPHI